MNFPKGFSIVNVQFQCPFFVCAVGLLIKIHFKLKKGKAQQFNDKNIDNYKV